MIGERKKVGAEVVSKKKHSFVTPQQREFKKKNEIMLNKIFTIMKSD